MSCLFAGYLNEVLEHRQPHVTGPRARMRVSSRACTTSNKTVAVRVGIADFDLPRIAALIGEAVESASSIVPRDPQDFIRRGQRRGVGPPRDSDGK